MTQPCQQEKPIAEMTTAVKFLADMAEKNNEIQTETLKTLKELVVQGEQIKGLTHRQDKTEETVDENLKEIYPRLRAAETAVTQHSEFIKSHEKEDDRNASLTIYVKGGVTVAAILAVTAFLLFLYAHSGYATRTEEVKVEKVEKKK